MEAILGNRAVQARLARAMADARMHHCYLFEGPPGVGKGLVARAFALSVNCEGRSPPVGLFGAPPPPPSDELWSCGSCRSCRLIQAGTHPDVLFVSPEEGRATPVISADQARDVLAALRLQRHSAARRVVVLDPADALTPEAGNALLKTLEEPPEGTQFLLLTARPAALLQTVRSRSQRVRFGPVPEAELRPWLEARGLDPALARASLGSPGVAVRLAEGAAAEREGLREELLATVGQPVPRLFAFTEGLAKKSEGGERVLLVLEVLEELFRDVCATAAGVATVHAGGVPESWVRGLWPGGVARMERAVASARERLALNVNGRVVLEALLSQLNLELAHAVRA